MDSEGFFRAQHLHFARRRLAAVDGEQPIRDITQVVFLHLRETGRETRANARPTTPGESRNRGTEGRRTGTRKLSVPKAGHEEWDMQIKSRLV